MTPTTPQVLVLESFRQRYGKPQRKWRRKRADGTVWTKPPISRRRRKARQFK